MYLPHIVAMKNYHKTDIASIISDIHVVSCCFLKTIFLTFLYFCGKSLDKFFMNSRLPWLCKLYETKYKYVKNVCKRLLVWLVRYHLAQLLTSVIP